MGHEMKPQSPLYCRTTAQIDPDWIGTAKRSVWMISGRFVCADAPVLSAAGLCYMVCPIQNKPLNRRLSVEVNLETKEYEEQA